jgi:uncharacterized iron-regulated membrane protein
VNTNSYRAIWRWHFHAGLFCIPFVILLAITGSIYLFKPQIDAFADRDVNSLTFAGRAATPTAQVHAALAAIPASRFVAYELPIEPDDAVRVHLRAEDGSRWIAYVHPQSLAVLKTVARESRLPEVVKTIHGELLIGNTGSVLVELAACWAIVMLLTGLYLWWPRNSTGIAGVLYPRIHSGKTVFWRDLHAVTGIWTSSLALFLLLTALPWTTVWGGAFKQVRGYVEGPTIRQDWAQSRSGEHTSDEHAEHRRQMSSGEAVAPAFSLDSVVPLAAALNIAPPVLIQPPTSAEPVWAIRGESQNRPLRREINVDANGGNVTSDSGFADRKVVDRVIGVGIAAHEGQLFGLANQLLGLTTALGLVTICVSAVVMWWRRRPEGELGIPATKVAGFRVERALAIGIVVLAILLPVFGASLVIVAAADRWLFGRWKTQPTST